MARPAKGVATLSKNLTKEEKSVRIEMENILKGSNDNLKPPIYLNDRQKEIFNYILSELKNSKILGNLDIFVLNKTAISIEKLEELDKIGNENISNCMDSSFRSMREMYSKDFFRCCNELCLSPQSRAKLSISAIPPKDKKTIMDILGDDD